MQLQIINTKDGSQTLYIAEMDEQYHSTNGAITESNYVYIEKGYMFNKSKNTTIFEVGFGTGLNCLLTALFAEKQKRHTIYYTIEKYPLDKEIIKQLKYGKNISAEAQVLFENIHACEWGKPVQISQYFSLIKLKSDLQKNNLKEIIIYVAQGFFFCIWYGKKKHLKK